MKIFIIGPEGAGKTVFLAMFSRFAATHADKYILDPANFESSSYTAATLKQLKRRQWPRSNPQGELKSLKWNFGRLGEKLHAVSLFDYSGQDMRQVLLEEDVTLLRGRSVELRKEVDDSDLLVYLLDLDAFIDGGDMTQLNENVWLLKAFLLRSAWTSKRRILVLTKADRFHAMISEAGGDLWEAIKEHWPDELGSSEVILKQKDKIDCFAVSSVKVAAELDGDGNPVMRPRVPLESEGFDSLVEGILACLERDRIKVMFRKGWTETCRTLSRIRIPLRRGRLSLWAAFLLGAGGYLFATDRYQFTFVTGTREGAGTDSSVKVKILDAEGSSKSTSFGGGYALWRWYDPFEVGQTSVFSKRFGRLESMREVTVEICDSGSKPAWLLESLTIENLATGERAVFPCGKWMGKDAANPGQDPWRLALTATNESILSRSLPW